MIANLTLCCVVIWIWMTTSAKAVTFQEMYTDCKDDYTCLMYPQNCATEGNCDLVAIIQKFGPTYRFRLLGKGPYYVAAGISKDRAMGQDAVAFCTEDIVGTAINTGGRNRTMLSDWQPDIGNVDMKIESGRLVCAFDVPIQFVADRMKINLAKPYYLLLATGPRQHLPIAGVPFAGHSIKLASYHSLLFGVGRANNKGRIGDENVEGGNTSGPVIRSSNYVFSISLLFIFRISP